MLKHLTLAVAAAAAVVTACKPPEGAVLLESGGTNVSWKLRASLGTSLALNVTSTSSAADDAVKEVRVKIEGTPDGGVAQSQLKKQAWMPLAVGSTTELSVTLLAKIAKGDLCYVNNLRLSGADQTVACKADGGPGPSGSENARAVCERLARTRIEGKADNYAVLNSSQSSFCTCLNGARRDLYFRAYDTPADYKQFEDSCRAVGFEKDQKIAELQRRCVELERGDELDVDVDPTLCLCGGTKLEYDRSEWLDKPEVFETRCRESARNGAPDDEFKRFRAECKTVGGKAEGLFACECGKESLKYEKYLPASGNVTDENVTAFRNECRDKLGQKTEESPED